MVVQRGGATQGAALPTSCSACRISCGTTSRAARRSRARTSRSRARPRTTLTASSASARWWPPPRPRSTSSPATISDRVVTWPRAACTSGSMLIASTPRTGRSSIPDPIGWTKKHRAKILAALYTILLGNPQLKAARDAEGKTRFKMWWRLGRLGGRARRQARRTRARLSEAVPRPGGG